MLCDVEQTAAEQVIRNNFHILRGLHTFECARIFSFPDIHNLFGHYCRRRQLNPLEHDPQVHFLEQLMLLSPSISRRITCFALPFQLVEWWHGASARHNRVPRQGRLPQTVCSTFLNLFTDVRATFGPVGSGDRALP